MAAFEVQSGVLTIGGFVTLNTYMLQAFQPLNMLGWIYREIRQSLIDMENLFEVLEEKAEAKFFGQPKSDFKSSIRFENICFSYKKERPVLSQITFSLSEGETLAIVGETGGGKTTIGRLLLKTINPVSGDIFLGDTNVRTLDQSVVREAIGVVPQDSVLFNASLRHNIGYGCLGASDEEIMAASDVAGLKGFILGLPDGLDTEVGARGLKVSGGEKQRIAIARVVLKNPQILLFDEATSSLDTTTESQIQANLNFIAKDRTTLIIAHRLSTVIYADEILVLDKGIIVEAGSHSELLAEKNVYAQLWAKQTT
jgi:ATP-binding cassette subfamily B protein